ncbi:MAG TPA: hypothetical protein VFI27_12980 [candidate division Zixibacteria bacterium]|nr:hypothetical protein [candidate division Zixibacteria bacterium]
MTADPARKAKLEAMIESALQRYDLKPFDGVDAIAVGSPGSCHQR